jgi:hypothetical protein
VNGEVMLASIAHARAGDKGDSSILFLAPDRIDDFPLLRRVITPERLAPHFGVPISGIRVRAVEGLAAISIVIPHRLDGGVTRSTTIDPHGKTLSGHLLQLMVPWNRNDTGPL